MGLFALDGSFWRGLAARGARGPRWFARFAPPVVGVAACALLPAQRRAIIENLRRVRGRRSGFRDLTDSARTFANYASCLAEALGGESAGGRLPAATVFGEAHVDEAFALARGIIFATAHTAGWETVAPALKINRGLQVLIAEAAERDVSSTQIQDDARRSQGLSIVHVGVDPLAALTLLRHLRNGGLVALQIDRTPSGQRAREVTLFDQPSHVPEGPFRLAALSGAPIVPLFTARLSYRRYKVVAGPPIRVDRTMDDRDLDEAAQRLATALQDFVREHPTQWFHFRAK